MRLFENEKRIWGRGGCHLCCRLLSRGYRGQKKKRRNRKVKLCKMVTLQIGSRSGQKKQSASNKNISDSTSLVLNLDVMDECRAHIRHLVLCTQQCCRSPLASITVHVYGEVQVARPLKGTHTIHSDTHISRQVKDSSPNMHVFSTVAGRERKVLWSARQ